MRWVTRALVHFDRVVSAWLILRRIDQEAQFLFIDDGEPLPDDAIPFGIPGARLGAHDGKATTFSRILEDQGLAEPSLVRMAAIVGQVVDHVMNDASRTDLSSCDPHVIGLLALAEGALLLSRNDADCITRSLSLYDALHARLEAQIALDTYHPMVSSNVLAQTSQLALAVSRMRATGAPFSVGAFADALNNSNVR